MIVLGIDPGTANTGYGIVQAEGARLRALGYGMITTAARTPLEERLEEIHAGVSELVQSFTPDLVAVEQLYFGTNVTSAFSVGHARGVILLAAGQAKLGTRHYTPQEVKQAVCGSGRADKDQVGRMVARLLGLAKPPTPDHTSDALAVAICAQNRAPLERAVSLAGASR